VQGKGLQSCELLEWHDSGRGSPEPSWSQLPALAIERGFAATAAWQPEYVPGRGAPQPEQLIVMGGQDSYWSVHKDGERLQIGPNGAARGGAAAADAAAAAAGDDDGGEAGEEEGVEGWGAAEWLQPLPEARKWTAMVTASLAW